MRRASGSLLLALLIPIACAPPPAKPVDLRGRTMGTTYRVTIAGSGLSAQDTAKLHAEIDARLARVNKLMSTYDPGSELSRFNRHPGAEPFPVSPETAAVLRAALRFSDESGGAFDATIGPLVDLWGFGSDERERRLPSEAEIRAALEVVGFRHLHVETDPPTLRKSIPGLRVDLNAIAKGYGVDAVAALLAERGFADFLVEIGGEVLARGAKAPDAPWRIGIDRPVAGAAPGRTLSAIVALDGSALATSGDYRNFFVQDGKRYSHIFDPGTGRPVTHRLASASVIAPTCMEADAAATAVMVLGPRRGKAFIESHPGWEALLIVGKPDGSFSELATEGFEAAIQGPLDR
ncbi:MAG: FAD:protein FMN transferase [Elusimicrobiota bacterium]